MLALIAAGFSVTSCQKDAAYDALTETDGIDMNVTIANQGLSIPLGSTDKIFLTELIDPNDSEVIDTDENGNYLISKLGNLDPTTFNIKAVDINATPTIQEKKFSFDVPDENISDPKILSYLKNNAEEGWTLRTVIENAIDKAISDSLTTYATDYYDKHHNDAIFAGLTEQQIQDAIDAIVEGNKQTIIDEVMQKINIPEEFTASCSDMTFDTNAEFPLTAHNVDNDLKSITEIHFDQSSNAVGFGLTVSGLPKTTSDYSISIEDFEVVMPYYVNMSNLDEKNPVIAPSQSNTISFSRNVKVDKVERKAVLDLGFRLDAVKLNDADRINNENGEIDRRGSITVAGKASIEKVDISTDNIVVKKKNGENHLGLKDDIVITPVITPIHTSVSDIVGYFCPDIKPIDTNVNINLGDDMDFLKENDVTLELKNPQIVIDIDNNCDIRMNSVFTLVASNGKKLTFNDVNLTPAAGKDHITVTLCAEAPQGATDTYANSEFRTFLQPVPDNINVHIDVKADEEHPYPLVLGNDIDIRGGYTVAAPLEFNNLHISYDEEVEDVFDDDITDYVTEIHNAELTFKAESTLPIDLTLELKARDHKGNLRPEGVVTLSADPIKANATSEVKAVLDIPNTAEVRDLIICVKGDGSDCSLVSTQYIIISDAVLKLNKLNIDLNDK